MTSSLQDRLSRAVRPGYGMKTPVLFASTGNVTLAGSTIATFDGITPSSGDRGLFWQQNSTWQNGVYVCPGSSGIWQRDVDFNGNSDVVFGTLVPVAAGSLYGSKFGKITSTGSGANGAHTFSSNSSTSDNISFSMLAPFASSAFSSSAATFVDSGLSIVSQFNSTLGFKFSATSVSSTDQATAIIPGSTSPFTFLGSTLGQLQVGPQSSGGFASGLTSSAPTINRPIFGATSTGTWEIQGAPQFGSTGIERGILTIASSGAGKISLLASTATITYSLTLPSSIGSSGQFLALGPSNTIIFQTQSTSAGSGTVNSGSSGQVAYYPAGGGAVVGGTTDFLFNAGALQLGSSGVEAGSVVLTSTGGGNTTLRGSTAAISYSLAFPSSMGSSGQNLQLLNAAAGLLGFVSAAAGGISNVKLQAFNSSTQTVYTASSGLVAAIIFCTGSGSSGGGVTGSANGASAGGGAAGGTAIGVFSAATIGSSQAVAIAAGANTTFGALLTGNAGTAGSPASSNTPGSAGAGGSATSGILNVVGGDGEIGQATGSDGAGGSISASGGHGGASFWGGGGKGAVGGLNANNNGSAANAPGAGGGGASGGGNGALGKLGAVLVIEFTST